MLTKCWLVPAGPGACRPEREREEEIKRALCFSVLAHIFHRAYDLQSGSPEINWKCHLCSETFCSSSFLTRGAINPVSGIYSLRRSGSHQWARLHGV